MKSKFTPFNICSYDIGNPIRADQALISRPLEDRRSRFLKGFTLVEVLIVVVIIAILAALTVPRMIAQTKKAESAEATQMIGAMKRAAERNLDLGVAGDLMIATESNNSWGCEEGTTAAWEKIGLKKPISSNWVYIYYTSSYPEYAGVALYKKDAGIEQYYYRYDNTVEYYCSDGMEYIDESNPMLGCRLS